MESEGVKPVVLFLCTGNSCRSQMTEAFLRHYAADRFDVYSAGMEPQGAIHPLAVRVMAGAGIDMSGQRPKGTKEYLGRLAVRHLVIVCGQAEERCPRLSTPRARNWIGSRASSAARTSSESSPTTAPACRSGHRRRPPCGNCSTP